MDDIEIDFSEFHPLDHRPFTQQCRLFPGGTKRHLEYAWMFRWKQVVLQPFYRLILCRVGVHDVVTWYVQDSPDDRVRIIPKCVHCMYTRLPSGDEIDNVPPFLNLRRSDEP